MRTTINIDEHVLARAKDEARRLGVTLGEYVGRAVQRELAVPPARATDPPLPVHHGRLLIPLERMSNADIQEFLDEGVPLDKLR
ncbi:MAG TPA: hypothetical protein VFT67_10535 [Jatrophihabitantaceae bacterium]|jgi:hypothetical protein|nr:hypothetical protein [Jatrophihabitantaceae bacterium]